MPFTDVSTVQGWADFGFKFHEGDNNVPWDDAHGVLSFRYTEPMTWWMPMPKGVPRTPAKALEMRDDLVRGSHNQARRMALVTQTAAMFNEDGQPALEFQDTPWCDGAVWSLNPNPSLGRETISGSEPQADWRLNAATVHWNERIKRSLYGAGAQGQLDGEYLDSLEGYMTANLNYRREHFAATSVPLTFNTDTRAPALFKGLAVFEFTRWIADDVHRLGKLVLANGVPYRFAFLCPWLDVLGTETDWLPNGRYQPASPALMDLWRTLSGAKPYLLLMNTDYDRFTPDLVERYFQRALFYGMWPSFFSQNASENPYWKNPNWYERDRPLFKKYIPVTRLVAEAGWRPVTHGRCDDERILLERFGPGPNAATYFTLYNTTESPAQTTLQVDHRSLGLASPTAAQELISGTELPRAGAGWTVGLGPHAAAVVRVGAAVP
jgi:hypothetical protein